MFSSLTQDFSSGLASDSSNVVDVSQSFQTSHRSFSHVAGVVGTQGLGSDVLDTSSLNDCTDSAAGDNAGTFGGGFEENAACAELTNDVMGNGSTLQCDAEHILLCVLEAFADCIRNLSRLAHAEADLAIAVADNNESSEFHDTAAFYGFGYAVDCDNLFLQFLLGFVFKSSQSKPSSVRN